MLSFLRSRCSGSLRSIYQLNVKYAQRSSGGGRRRPQQLWSGQGNEDMGSEMLEEAEEIEDLHDWFEKNVAKPEFQKIVASEEEKLRRKITHKIIERKYYKKPQEVCLLTWDAKEQIRFLNNEYPNEWTVDRLAESFPISREGVIKILKSRFQPKSLAEVVKHDERVKKHWKELQDGSKKGMLSSGPVTSRYQELLKSAAGNPSLPMPDLNRFLLPSGKGARETEKTGTFLSIVQDYCDKKQGATDADALKQVKSKEPDQGNLLGEHIAQNRKLIEGVVEKSPKHLAEYRKPIKGMIEQSPNLTQNRKPIKNMIEQSPNLTQNRKPIKNMIEQSPNHLTQSRKPIKNVIEQSPNHLTQSRKPIKNMIEQSPNHLTQSRKPIKNMTEQSRKQSEGHSSDLYKTLETEKHSFDVQLNTSARQSMNVELHPKQLIDSDFDFSPPENEEEDNDEDILEVLPQRRGHGLRRRSVDANIAKQETNRVDGETTDAGMEGTKKLGVSEDVMKKMETNSRLAREREKFGSRHAVDSKMKAALQNMNDEDNEQGTEVYMFSEEKGYQHPFGRRKDLPDGRIPVPRDKLKSGVEFRKGNDFYDEDGEFLYRTP